MVVKGLVSRGKGIGARSCRVKVTLWQLGGTDDEDMRDLRGLFLLKMLRVCKAGAKYERRSPMVVRSGQGTYSEEIGLARSYMKRGG